VDAFRKGSSESTDSYYSYHIKLHFPRIAILGLSVNANEYRDTMLEVGATAVIQKDTMHELHGAIRAAVQEAKRLHGTAPTCEL